MTTVDPEARRAAIAMLARGLLTPSEAAELGGVSRQLMRYWIKAARVDWLRIRKARNARNWRKQMGRGMRLIQIASPLQKEDDLEEKGRQAPP